MEIKANLSQSLVEAEAELGKRGYNDNDSGPLTSFPVTLPANLSLC